MRRRRYLSAVAAGIGVSGCLGGGRPPNTDGGSGALDDIMNGGSGGDGGQGQVDRTETPRPVPDPVRDPNLRPGSGPAADTRAIEISLHEHVNGVRREYGLSLLAWIEDMNDTARAHSRDMAHNGYFSKESPDGETFRPPGCQEWEELLFRMMGTDTSPDRAARNAIRAWAESESHREKMVDARFSGHGVGAAKSNDGWIYISQSLCG